MYIIYIYIFITIIYNTLYLYIYVIFYGLDPVIFVDFRKKKNPFRASVGGVVCGCLDPPWSQV